MTVLVHLEWPEKCFRMNAEALRRLKALLPAGAEVVRARTERAFLRHLGEATHAIVWSFRPEWFAAAPKLRVLATPAAGREFVPECGPKGVRIHFGAFHGPLIAESAAAFALGWKRGFFRPERAGSWPRQELSDKCGTLAGTRAVVVGFGHVGRAIGEKLETLGVAVTGVTRRGVFRRAKRPCLETGASLSEQMKSADWLVLALPSTTGTDNWLDAARLRQLPRTCVVMNVGRGNAVDERALCAALKARRIAGAYLDVRKHEPTATVLESPGFVPELASLDNCFVMPHAAAFSDDYLARCFDELAEGGYLK